MVPHGVIDLLILNRIELSEPIIGISVYVISLVGLVYCCYIIKY